MKKKTNENLLLKPLLMVLLSLIFFSQLKAQRAQPASITGTKLFPVVIVNPWPVFL
jgi:hypothetical protein